MELTVLLAQSVAGNNLYELKDEIRQLLYFLYHDLKITKTVYTNLINTL